MRKFIPILILAVLMPAAASYAQNQEIVVPFLNGEGWAVKKEAVTNNNDWELKVLYQGGGAFSSERTVVTTAAYYNYDFPEDMKDKEFDPTGEDVAMDEAYFDQLKTVPIRRYIECDTQEVFLSQVDAFLDAYNQMYRTAPPDEPITMVIDRAVWQYWFNQVVLWQQYVNKGIFLKKNFKTDTDTLDFSAKDALISTLQAMHQKILDEAEKISKENNMRNVTFIVRLDHRENRRKDYQRWLDDQADLVTDFAQNWLRRQEGYEVSIDGTTYLLSDKPLDRIPRNTVNVVTNYLTPYDILNADGTLKKPIE